jgi:hypothetical protein
MQLLQTVIAATVRARLRKGAVHPFFEKSVVTPTQPNVLYAMEHDVTAAGVLSMPEMEAAIAPLLSEARRRWTWRRRVELAPTR